MPAYQGGCHCGRVRFAVETEEPIAAFGDCNCSVCQKKGILHVRVAPEKLTILSGADDIETYRFHSMTAEHNFCRHCGIHVTTKPRMHPTMRTANARCLDDFAALQAAASVATFDGQNHPKDQA